MADRQRWTVALALGALALSHITPAPARAQDGAMSLQDIALMLQSQNQDEVQMALEAAAVYGKPKVVPLVMERTSAGLPAPLLNVALDALTLIGNKKAAPLFTKLARHRRKSVRVRALKGLVVLGTKGAPSVLEGALADQDADVRVAAANGLAELGARGALDTLFVAFDRGVLPAAGAIGKLARARDISRIAGYLGKVPFGQMRPMLDGLLERNDVKSSAKLRIIGLLEELATPESKDFLETYAKSLPLGKLRSAAQDSASRIATP